MHTFPGIAPVTISTEDLFARLQKFVEGKGYEYGIQTISPSAAGNFVNVRLRNPTGSGKTAKVTRVWVVSNIAARFEYDVPEVDSGANLATLFAIDPKRQGQAAGVVVASHQNSTPGNGVGNPHPIGLAVNVPVEVLLGQILPANSQLDMVFSNTAATTNYSFLVEWYEE